MGMALRIQGNQAGAKAAHEQALLLAREIERIDLEAEALEQIGLNLEHADDPTASLGYHQQALAHWQTLDETEQMIHSLNHIGDAQRSLADLDAARTTLEQALLLVQNLPDKAYLQAQIRGNLAGVYYEQGDLDAAETQWLTALATFDALGVAFDKIAVLNNLGGLAVQRQQHELALDYFGRSFTLAEAIGDQRGLKTALTNMAIVLRDRGNWT
jgi:tetratricopeptide (TPR) repeat protein